MQPQQPGGQQPAPNYDFIFNPQQPQPRPRFSLGGGNSMAVRIGLVLGGLLVVLILFSVIKGLLGGSGANVAQLNQVLQSQQELTHLTNASSNDQLANLNQTNQDFAVTTQLSLTSQQSQLETYMKTNHEKINTKLLNAKVSASVDTELSNAVSAGTYDATFSQIMQSELTSYMLTLKSAYAVTTGSKGRAQLNADYNGAQLLNQQLGLPQN